MAKVIIVSNRLPISVKKDNGQLVFSSSIGGLATGLASYVTGKRNNLWIGWPGIASDDLSDAEEKTITNTLFRQGYVPVFLSQKQIDDFYSGFSNSILWPLFHGLSFKASDDQQEDWWRAYRSVNRRFAEVILSLVDNKSQIWIHDYLLMLLPSLIRAEQKSAHIGFFLHIPFPEFKTFKNLKESSEILNGVLGADLIGFHTQSYVQNFMDSVGQLDLGIVDDHQVTAFGRQIRVQDFPMGIDYDKFASSGRLEGVKKAFRNYSKKYRGIKVIASVDRLDPSKGLVERLKAYGQYLERTPKSHGKVVFVMVAAPSRTEIADYQRLSEQLDKTVKDINAKFGTKNWQPVDYINESISFENVTALFQRADVAFITPIRDGMNLAAKEFIASNKRGGVLILSSTAGAAEELRDALIVNPKKPDELVEALNLALHMRRRELKGRLKRMRKYLSGHTVQDWAQTFIETLEQPVPGTPNITHALNERLRKRLIKQYVSASKRLLLLDYDGSLVPYTNNYAQAQPPKALVELLRELAKIPSNEVVLVSGRKASELEKWFGKLRINLIAEHGASIRNIGEDWQNIGGDSNEWQELILPTLEKYALLTPGATIEVKPHSIVWHYRSAQAYYAQKYSVVLKRSLRPFLRKRGLELIQGNKILEIKNPKINKGKAVEKWMKRRYDFILAIGDDTTDEDLFAVLPPSAYAIKIGRGITQAQYRLTSNKDAIKLLKHLT